MKKLIAALIAVAGVNAFAGEVQPDAAKGPLYTCRVSGSIHGGSIAIIVGGQYIRGPGMVSCRHNVSGKRYNYPVQLRLIGAGVGLELSHINKVNVYSAGIGVNNPSFFMKSFALGATAGASLIHAGIDFDAAVRLSKGGAGFEVGLQGKDILGLGAHLYAMHFRIKPRH